jgi:type VI secretion system protein ImpF
MRKPKGARDYFQVPLMFAFRDAFSRGDAGKQLDNRVGGERVIAERGSLRRRGAEEALVKENFSLDLLSLVNTVNLAAAVDLTGLEYVEKSVLNFGLSDITHLTSEDGAVSDVSKHLLDSLAEHEPRLHRDTLRVERSDSFDDVNQRIRFVVSGELACRPLDIPIEFVAEVDVGSGKVQLTRLPGTT